MRLVRSPFHGVASFAAHLRAASLGFLILAGAATALAARVVDVPLAGPAWERALAAAAERALRSGVEATPSTEARIVLPVLLGPGEEVASIEAPWPVVDLGTGSLQGLSIAHLALPAAKARNAARGTRLRVVTRSATERRTELLRTEVETRVDRSRLVAQLGLDPDALALYVHSGITAAAPRPGPFLPATAPSIDGSPVQCLILTRATLAPAFEEWAAWRTGRGVPTVVRTVEWVVANYPHGADLAETLRGFVREAYSLWGIRSILLGGDTDLVPTRYASSVYSLEGDAVPTDLYYACLDGNWNADGDARWGEGFTYADNQSDNADLYPEILVGRLPVTTPVQVADVLEKMRAYVEPSAVDYQNALLFLAEVIWPASYFGGGPILKNGADNAERLIELAGLDDPRWTLTRMYETPQFYPGAVPLTRTAALAAMDAGHALVVDIGHGFRYTMSLGDASMTNVNAALLENSTRPFFLNMLNCSAAAFDFPCLAEKFLLNPNGGAIGVIGSTREAYPDNIQVFQEGWFDALFLQGYAGAAEALNETRLRYVSQTYDDGAYRWSNFITSYLGDPETELWLQAPRPAVVSHVGSMSIGATTYAVTVTSSGAPVPGALVCLQKSGDFYATARTNLAGTATLAVSAETTGPAGLCVAGAGLLTQRGTVNVNSVAAPALRVIGTAQVVDSGSGTLGNGNGMLEASETVQLRFTIENRGGSVANGVTLQVACTDPMLLPGTAAVSVGTLGPGAQLVSSPVTALVANNALDQTQIRLDVILRSSIGNTWTDRVLVDVLQASPRILRTWVDDRPVGNSDGVPQANETYDLRFDLKNYGFGALQGVTAQLSSVDPDVVILNNSTTLGSIGHLGAVSGSFKVRETNVTGINRMVILVVDVRGRIWPFSVETRRPQPATGVVADASVGTGIVRMTWNPSPSPDVAGYVVYRSPTTIGPWSRASLDLVRSSLSFQDEGLPSGTKWYYNLSAVDSSGNESARSGTLSVTTNPPQLAGWPQPLGIWSNSSPVLADLDGDGRDEVVVGASDRLYAWKSDGVEVRDGDANPATTGVFSALAGNFMPGLAAGDFERDGRDEIVACTFDTRTVYVLNGDGSIRPGWPKPIVSTTHGIWATPALGDVDNDGTLDIVVLALDGRLYAWRANGTELRDGDANPATNGVFFQIPGSANWSRGGPAIANILPSDATPEIIFGSENNRIYVLRANGTIATGWPRVFTDKVQAAPSIGDVDGDGTFEIAVPVRDGMLYLLRPDGTNFPNWPRPLQQQWNALTPSVALADFEGDGKLELVAASTGPSTHEGSLYMFDWQGNVRPGFPVNVLSSSEASPIVGDLDGDGKSEIVYGGESGILYAITRTGATFPGFPIRVGAEVRGTPTMGDADGDGHVDLLLAGWDQQVYLWRFPAYYVRDRVPWGAFKGNALRNGVYDFRLPTDGPDDRAPARTVQHPNVPNPFNPTTTLHFDIGAGDPRQVRIAIFDVRGRRVRALLDRKLGPGRYSERWDGRDDAGNVLPSGVYFSRLDATELQDTRKIVLLR